jgi:putative endonuclease
MKDFIYVYILVSKRRANAHYSGVTRGLRERLTRHNQGRSVQNSRDRPWRFETVVAFKSEKKAPAFEKYLKTGSGREFARRHF